VGIGFEPALTPDGGLAGHESKTLEYKRDLSPKERILRTLVAFANSAGGSLVVGVDDDHGVLGVVDPLTEENRLANLIANGVRPTLRPELAVVTVGARSVLVAEVFPGGKCPFWVKAEGPKDGVYVRLGSSTLQADEWQIASLRRQSEGIVFDAQANHRATKGLDDSRIAAAFPDRQVPSAKAVLLLEVEDQGTTVPTNGGVLLFGHDRERLFPDAWVQCGRFQGPKGLDLTDQVELYAPLLEVPDLVEAFLKKHAFRGADLTEWRRKDDWSVPVDILREAAINALIHSDYGQRGGPIRVAFYDDRVYVESLGGLLPGMTVEMMRGGVSRVRNQVIARAFREAGMIEQWGYGVRRMFDRAEALGLPEPSYVELPGRLRFVVPTRHAEIKLNGRAPAEERLDADSPSQRQSHHVSQAEVGVGDGGHQQPVLSDTPSHQESHQESHPVSPQAVELVRLASERPVSRAELLSALGMSNDTRNARRHVEPLLLGGFLELTEPDNPRSRNQRYRATALGAALVRRLGLAP
jgi:predicted HTH transcriptional regulator